MNANEQIIARLAMLATFEELILNSFGPSPDAETNHEMMVDMKNIVDHLLEDGDVLYACDYLDFLKEVTCETGFPLN